MASALLVAGCGSAAEPITPFPSESHWQPGLVGLSQYPPQGLGPDPSVTPSPSAAPTIVDPTLDDPTQAALAPLGLQPADVTSDLIVAPIEGGTTLEGGPTLDLCGGSFPSEALRVTRRQVAAFTAAGAPVGLSTEVVRYESETAAAEAMAELVAARKGCPEGVPVTVGTTTTTFTFHPAPGPSDVPLVDADNRVVVHSTVVRDSGTRHLLVVYQRIGSVIVGLYAAADGAGPFDQASLDSTFILAGRIADRMRAASGTSA